MTAWRAVRKDGTEKGRELGLREGSDMNTLTRRTVGQDRDNEGVRLWLYHHNKWFY